MSVKEPILCEHSTTSFSVSILLHLDKKEKELTDRALRLAEIGKPKFNWELQGLLGLVAFAFGFFAGK